VKIIKLSKEFKLERKLDDYIREYVPVRLSLPKRKLDTARDYFDRPTEKKGYFR